MVSFSTSRPTVSPFASKTEIVSALSTDVVVAEMNIECLRVRKRSCTWSPATEMLVRRGGGNVGLSVDGWDRHC